MTEISYECRPVTDAERERTAQYLRAHTEAVVGLAVIHVPFGLVAYENGRMVGSIVGKIFFNWLHIELTWVDEALRGKGLGRQLMAITAEQAKQIGLSGIEVWTQSWQAPEFYKKIGYEEFAVIDDFTPGQKRHAFRLYLKAHA